MSRQLRRKLVILFLLGLSLMPRPHCNSLYMCKVAFGVGGVDEEVAEWPFFGVTFTNTFKDLINNHGTSQFNEIIALENMRLTASINSSQGCSKKVLEKVLLEWSFLFVVIASQRLVVEINDCGTKIEIERARLTKESIGSI